MRYRNPIRTAVGIVLIAVGMLILFARVLPSGFWWFCVGAALVAAGVACLGRRHC